MKAPTKTPTKRTTDVDRLVGAQIRLRRHALDMTQTQLADQLGVTFQQVQKYELGTNRVGASRLADIARALSIPITDLFRDVAGADAPAVERDEIRDALQQRGALDLLRAYATISDRAVRSRVLNLVRAPAGQGEALPDAAE